MALAAKSKSSSRAANRNGDVSAAEARMCCSFVSESGCKGGKDHLEWQEPSKPSEGKRRMSGL